MSKTSPINEYRLKNGQKRFRFQIYIGINPLTGKEERTTSSGYKSRKQAELALASMKLEIEKGTFRKQHVETFSDVYNLWMNQYKKDVEKSTLGKTKGIFRNHILPKLGQYRIQKMDVDICQYHVNEWSDLLVNFSSVRDYASSVLDFAIIRGYILTNPFDLVKLPKIKKTKKQLKNFYTRDELINFLEATKQEGNDKHYAFFRLLSYTGMRKGEAFALTWNDINFKENEIHICKAISLDENNKIYLKGTKTGDTRTLKMDSETMEILMEWKSKQSEMYGYNTFNQNQLVFSDNKNEYIFPSKSNNWIKRIQNKYNLKKITTHGLRHTHCTLLFQANVSLKEVQDRMGHSDARTTLEIYTHVTKKTNETAIVQFDSFMESNHTTDLTTDLTTID